MGIYLNQECPKNASLNYQIGYYANELSACERLLKMGYATSNNTNLGNRADWLEKEIHRLEEIRASMRKRHDSLSKLAAKNRAIVEEMNRIAFLVGLALVEYAFS